MLSIQVTGTNLQQPATDVNLLELGIVVRTVNRNIQNNPTNGEAIHVALESLTQVMQAAQAEVDRGCSNKSQYEQLLTVCNELTLKCNNLLNQLQQTQDNIHQTAHSVAMVAVFQVIGQIRQAIANPKDEKLFQSMDALSDIMARTQNMVELSHSYNIPAEYIELHETCADLFNQCVVKTTHFVKMRGLVLEVEQDLREVDSLNYVQLPQVIKYLADLAKVVQDAIDESNYGPQKSAYAELGEMCADLSRQCIVKSIRYKNMCKDNRDVRSDILNHPTAQTLERAVEFLTKRMEDIENIMTNGTDDEVSLYELLHKECAELLDLAAGIPDAPKKPDSVSIASRLWEGVGKITGAISAPIDGLVDGLVNIADRLIIGKLLPDLGKLPDDLLGGEGKELPVFQDAVIVELPEPQGKYPIFTNPSRIEQEGSLTAMQQNVGHALTGAVTQQQPTTPQQSQYTTFTPSYASNSLAGVQQNVSQALTGSVSGLSAIQQPTTPQRQYAILKTSYGQQTGK